MVVACDLDGDGRSDRRHGRVILRGSAARYVARLVNAARPVSAPDVRCYRPAEGVLLVAQPDGGVRRGSLHTGCRSRSDPSARGDVIVIGSRAAQLVAGVHLTSDIWPVDPLPRDLHAVDLTGRSFLSARAFAAAAGYTMSGSEQVLDASLPTGTVILQHPAPGYITQPLDDPPSPLDREDEHAIEVVTTVRPAPRCAPRQLATEYHAGGTGTGDIFGVIVLRDISARACSLSGRVSLTGVDRHGDPVIRSVHPRIARAIVLSARQPRAPRHPPPAEPGHWAATIEITAIYDCPDKTTTPHAWRLRIATGTIDIRNLDRHAHLADFGDLPSLYVCHSGYGAPDLTLLH